MSVKLEVVDIKFPEGVSVIIGQAHFMKTVVDLYEALATSHPQLKFGVAFNESSAERRIFYEGNDDELKKLAVEIAKNLGAGHIFVVAIRNGWPINVLNRIKMVQEVCTIFCATSNQPLQIIVAETDIGRAILGVVDGYSPIRVENEEDRKWRIEFLKKLGYKL
ncbi:MAG: adenosine-specific kinase [Crenarchaeota archaeon]|nr:adenosine-specific kinase [Thermoproteota archaeon]MCR8454551.1 adenosine-specific kinase [Thermoproteota archaeon]MCR8455025.1 adenosine-specific kinase [Thermoproteota archaeon]MCR8463253.1 adenosine-specific kinase [Thermoproteota archaeon]MCR8470473.1 adenosine-specific kinase [Thermoproteota archaeon]